jgi:hypothetical protein
MVQVTCDVCGKGKPRSEKRLGNDLWILGYDIEVENSSGLQRSMRFLSHWDDARVLELGAIHLCSETCKGKYVRHARAA